MSAVLHIPHVQVLTNRGIPVLVHKVEPGLDGVRFNRVYEGEGENETPVLETEFVRLTTLAQAEIEDKYTDPTSWWIEHDDEDGNVRRTKAKEGDPGAVNLDPFDLWEERLTEFPNKTMLDTFALMWECTRQEAGKRLIDDHVDEYATALGGAVLLANGGSPDAVVRLLRQGVSSSTRLRADIAQSAEKAVAQMEAEDAAEQARRDAAAATQTPQSPSPEPSQPSYSSVGANSDDPSPSSGN